MFQPWRLQVRRAEEALRQGRLEEAGRLLAVDHIRDFLPAKRLMARLAQQVAQRSKDRLAQGDSLAGWNDLEAAASLGADPKLLEPLRATAVAEAVAEVERYLAAGDPLAALDRLEQLSRRHLEHRRLRELKEAALKAQQAQQLARRGHLAAAAQELAVAASLAPDLPALAQAHSDMANRAAQYADLGRQLHEHLAAKQWNEALALADRLLALAPDDPVATSARCRAWGAVGGTAAAPGSFPAVRREARNGNPPAAPAAAPDASPGVFGMHSEEPLQVANLPSGGPRFLLWIDEVGGFLVCQGDSVAIGQPVPGVPVDIPLLADLSSRHAVIRRLGEGYVLEALRPTKLNGVAVSGRLPLADGALIELGAGAKLRFRKPHPLSASARLEFVSHHRTQPSADAVILMAQSCVLGPTAQAHIPCRAWTREVLLYRDGARLGCRTGGAFQVDGRPAQEQAQIGRQALVAGEDFSFNLEQLVG